MDVKDYCHSMEIELNGWKAKMYNMIRKVDKLNFHGMAIVFYIHSCPLSNYLQSSDTD